MGVEGRDRDGLLKRGQARQRISTSAMNQLLANALWALATIAAAAERGEDVLEVRESLPVLARVVEHVNVGRLEEVAR